MHNRIKQIRVTLNFQQGEFAQKINILQQQLSKYERGENKPSADFFIKLVEVANVNINWLLTGKGKMFVDKDKIYRSPDAVEIKYYDNPALIETIKNPVVSSIWLDRELVHNIWQRSEDDLRIMQMTGDIMDGGDSPIRNQDMLIIDTTSKDIMHSGVYAYTTIQDSFIFVNGIKQKIDGSVKFNYWNKNYAEVIYNHSDLEKIGFKVLGRVIKNMSIR